MQSGRPLSSSTSHTEDDSQTKRRASPTSFGSPGLHKRPSIKITRKLSGKLGDESAHSTTKPAGVFDKNFEF